MAVFNNIEALAGVYWNAKPCEDINFETDDKWSLLTSVEDITDEVINNIQSIGIITYYGSLTDASRASFAFTLPKGKWVVEAYDSQKNYGTIYQWMFFLSYKNIIDPLFDALKISYIEGKNFWTTTVYNEGNLDGSNAIQWMVDLKYNSRRISYKNGFEVGVEVYTIPNGCWQPTPNIGLAKSDAKLSHGIYYCEGHPNEDETIFFPVREESVINDTITPKYIVFNALPPFNEPFWIQIEESNNVQSGTWRDNIATLTKYQWDVFLAYKDLVDKVYDFMNLNNPIGNLAKYGIPDLVWTSTDYMAKENTIGYYEVHKGKGIKWVVCPSIGSSDIVLKKGIECKYPNVGIWE